MSAVDGPARRAAAAQAYGLSRRSCQVYSYPIFVLFSLASAKLIPYLRPAIPLCAILIADAIMNLVEASRESGIEAQHAVPDVRRLAAIGPLLGIAGAGLMAVALHEPLPYAGAVGVEYRGRDSADERHRFASLHSGRAAARWG